MLNQSSISERRHSHTFFKDSAANEKNTRLVVIITSVMMVGEIVGGLISRSMALTADGFHMGTHAFALGVTLLAYWYARRNARNPVFSFGTGKVNDLGAYTSAILLLVVAVIMAYESVKRLLNPVAIQFDEAIVIACIGLGINLLSAWILRDRHVHSHAGKSHHQHNHAEHDHAEHDHAEHDHAEHDHAEHDHGQHDHAHRDHNLKAAYLHVLADALTSVLAIIALVLGKSLGWVWMDPIMGVVGSIVITRWSIGLLRETSGVLLDKTADDEMIERIRERIESEDEINEVHLWEVGSADYAVILSVHSAAPKSVEYYRSILAEFPNIVHSTVEITSPIE